MPLKTESTFGSITSNGSGSPHTPKAVSPEQRDIEAIWRQVHEKVVQLAGSDPAFQIQKTLDIDGVLRRLDSLQEAGNKHPDKFSWLKHAVRRTLQCIQTVGGMVVDGVSEVFGPSHMCYNALTWVIQAWQNYEGMFENLAELLEKCADFLTRLRYYEDNMDANLSRLACQNLGIFVEICDRAIRLRKKHTRLIRFTKLLFLNDDGIQDLLGMMEKLNKKEMPLVNAQIFKTVMDSAGKLDLALEEQRQQRTDEDWRKRRKAIAAALGFPRNAVDMDGEPIQHWLRAFGAHKAALVEGTGEWIEQDHVFLEWARSKLPTNPVLVLQGRNRSGKTSMMTNVLRVLRRMDLTTPTSRKVLVYFFPEADRRKSDDEDTSTFIERISRILLWQIATAYEAMTKSVAHIIEKAHDFDGCLDLWERVFIENKERQKDTTFYICIDGIDSEIQSLLPLLEKLCSVTDDRRPRIFLTARPETVTGWIAHAKHIHYETIPISKRNGDDVHKYINYQMDTMQITKNPDRHENISRWRQMIHDELYAKCGGDYFKLVNTFDRLSKVDLVDDVMTILRDAGKTRTDQIDAEIRRLNKERTRKEIQEINEIILWIEGGREWFSVETMEALLSVKHRRSLETPRSPRPPPPVRRSKTGSSPRIGLVEEPRETSLAPASSAISLLPFAQKLQEKYGLFAITSSNTVDWRSSEYKERIPSKSFDPGSSLNAASSTGPQVIQEAEIEIVRHFLKNVCPSPLYNRFEFEQFFEGKIGARQKEYISVDDDNENIKIAIACLTILTEEEIRSDTRLRYYAMYWLLDHLTAVELSLADRELKAQAGPLLVRLFTEKAGIDSLFWPFDTNVSMKTWRSGELKFLREVRSEWLYSTEGVQELRRWFNDPVVARSVTSETGQAFLAGIKGAPNAKLHEAVLSYAARCMADHLFRRIEFTRRQFLSACCFIRGYLARLDPVRSSEMSDEAAAYRQSGSIAFGQFEDESFTLEEVDQIEIWASQILERHNDTSALESSWEIHGALIVFQLCSSATEVYHARARRALELNEHNWHACHFIASRPVTANDEALQMLLKAKNDIDALCKKNKDWLTNHANSSLLARITLELGNRLWESGKDYVRAAETHRESLQYDYVHFREYGTVLESYYRHQCWDMSIAFVRAINDHKEVWASYFDELVNDFLLEFVIKKDSDMLAQAADATQQWDVIERFFDISTEMGRKSDAHDLLFLLRDALSRIFESAADGAHGDKAIAIREAALHSVRSHPSDTLERGFVDKMVDSLALTYLHLAARPSIGPEQLDRYGTLIESLIPETDESFNIFLNVIPTSCLIRYHHRHGRSSWRAVDLTYRIIRTSIELLFDDDEGNDILAYWLLARLATVVGDVENLRIIWTMENKLQYEAVTKWEIWQASKDGTGPSEDSESAQETPTRLKDSGQIILKETVQIQVVDSPVTYANPVPLRAARQGPDPSHPGETKPGTAPDSSPGSSKSHKRLTVAVPATEMTRAAPAPPQAVALATTTTTTITGMVKAAPTPPQAAALVADASRSPSITPSRVSDSGSTGAGDPQKPSSFVSCDGCGKQWTVMEVPLYTCADCVGDVQFDEDCYALLQKGELRTRNLRCRKDHEMFLIPKWEPGIMRDVPKGCVPLVEGSDKDGNKWVTMEEWKRRLVTKYLGDYKKETSAMVSSGTA
ncbi:hypothetical protein DL770_006479 [Monosporascus sp. CRB-9-2]|nr:hypothetical protein DL770_006479 [Monosporascus sp. CRB-9-2]